MVKITSLASKRNLSVKINTARRKNGEEKETEDEFNDAQYEDDLKQVHGDKTSVSVRKLLDFFIHDIGSFRLVKAQESTLCMINPPLNILCYDNLFKIREQDRGQSTRSIFNRRFTRILVFVMITYSILKSLAMAIIQHKRDFTLQDVKPKVRANSNRTEKCALKENIYFENQFEYEQKQTLRNFIEWLDFLGSPMLSVTGGCAVLLDSRIIYATLFYYWSMIYVSYNKLLIDHLGFIYYPVQEWRRVKRQFLNLVEEFSSRTEIISEHTAADENLHLDFFKRYQISTKPPSGCFYNSYNNNYNGNSSNTNICNDSIQSIHSNICQNALYNNSDKKNSSQTSIKEILSDSKFINSLRPANLKIESYKRLIATYKYTLTIGTTSACSAGLGLTACVVGFELWTRVKHRLDMLECQKWMPNGGTLIMDYIPLLPLRSQEDFKTYEAHDESFASSLKLVLIEIRSFELRFIICFIELQLLVLLCSFWVMFYFTILIASHSDKSRWLKQIEHQVKYSTDLLRQHKISTRFQMPIYADEFKNNEKKLMKSLLVAYFNYELFRRRQKSFKQLVNFLLMSPMAITMSTLALCYYIGTKLSSDFNPVLLIVSTFIVLFNNMYLFVCSRYTARSDKLMRNIMRLIANSAEQSPDVMDALKFWRHQVLSEVDIRLFYAPNIFGVNVSYKLLLSFNAYLVVLWLVLVNYQQIPVR